MTHSTQQDSTIDDYKTCGLIGKGTNTDEIVKKIWDPVVSK